MIDGLYLFGQWVAEVSVICNKQANDLSSPATLNLNYTNLFTLPDTTLIRSLLQNAEQVDSGGRDPYRRIPATLIEEGEVIFSGSVSLETFQAGWKVSFAGSGRSLIDQLAALKLSDLDLSQYDHPWTLDSVALFVGNTDGILYPLIDNGSIDGGVFAQDTISPAIYASSLIRQMLKQFGYRPVGAWLTDALLKRIFLPFTGDRPRGHDQDWVTDRQARVAVPNNLDPIVLKDKSPINILLPFTVDNQPLDGFVDGRINNYKADRAVYVCDTAIRLKVQSSVNFIYIVRIGAANVRLIVEKNGQNVGEAYHTKGGYADKLDFGETLTVDVTIDCRPGDEIRIRLTGGSRTKISDYAYYFSRTLGDLWVSFEPDASVYQGDAWPVATNLPDMTCADLLKTVALMCSATLDIDETRKTVELKTLDGIIADEANATDLSHAVEENTEPEFAAAISPYGQKNALKWRTQEDKTLIGYGDGVIGCDAQNLPPETTLFELPFAAVIDSTVNVPGYGLPVLVQTRTVTGSGANIQVSYKASPPVLLLAEPSVPVKVIVNKVTPELTTVPTAIELTPCWWHKRADLIALPDNSFSLAFDPPPGSDSREQTLIQRYFSGIKRVLRRPRQLTVSVYLRPAEFAALNLYAPVRLRGVRAGSLDINDNYFYLNKVSNYRAAVPCSLVLIAY
ncbi:hypothetical protein [Spirosoma arcticum]